MTITALTSVLSYMRDAGATVRHRAPEGELWLRVSFPGLAIRIVTDEKGVVSFVLEPIEPVLSTDNLKEGTSNG